MNDTQESLITFSEEDVKSGYVLQGSPDWFDLKVLEVRSNIAKSGKSTNYFVKVRCEEAGELQNVIFTIMFNDTPGDFGKGRIRNLLVAANNGEELTPGKAYNWNDVVGITLRGYVQRGADQNGNPINDVKDFRPKK